MSISKGSQSVKPYVGSKEVKEAYVGSQLVYRSTPPFNGVFFDSTTKFILEGYAISPLPSDIKELGQSSAYNAGYYIWLQAQTGSAALPYIRWGELNIPAFNTLVISSPYNYQYPRNFTVIMTFKDGTSINTTVRAWLNNPGRINIDGKRVSQLEIRAGDINAVHLISNISLI